jgi:lipopolysaccharide export system protein LptC
MPNLKPLVGTIGTLGLFLLCIWQWIYSQQKTPLLDSNTLQNLSNIIIHDLQYRQFDAHGTLTHFLETPTLEHIPKNDKHILTQPHLVVTEPNQEPWEMHADQGTAIAKATTVTLRHHVQINQHKNNEEMVLKTEKIIYFPQEKKATSSTETFMSQGNTQVRSTGFVANLADNDIHLVNARGRHEQKNG